MTALRGQTLLRGPTLVRRLTVALHGPTGQTPHRVPMLVRQSTAVLAETKVRLAARGAPAPELA
jgi:hypothetical protein